MKPWEFSTLCIRLATITGFWLLLFAVYTARDVVVSLVLAALLVMIISPILSAAERRRMPTLAALSLLYVGGICFGLLLLFAVIPILSREFVNFANVLQGYAKFLSSQLAGGDISSIPGIAFLSAHGVDLDRDMIASVIREHGTEVLSWLSDKISSIIESLWTGLLGIFGTLTNAAFALVLAFFLALERTEIYTWILSQLPVSYAKRIQEATEDTDHILFMWIRWQALLCASIFIGTYIGLYVLEWVFGINLRGHFPLALIAGMCEFIPIIGPIIASIPAIMIALSLGPVAVGLVILLYFLVQQSENLLLVPYIQGNALQLSNFTVLIAMSMAGSLFGIVGILFTLPVLAVLKILCFPTAPDAPNIRSKNLKK